MLQSFSVIAPDRSRVSGVRSEWHSRGQRFDPAYLHQNRKIRICLPWATGSGFSFPCMKRHRPGAESAAAVSARYRRRFSVHTARISSRRENLQFQHFSSERKFLQFQQCLSVCYSFQQSCHGAWYTAENWRRSAPKQAHICGRKSCFCKLLIFSSF